MSMSKTHYVRLASILQAAKVSTICERPSDTPFGDGWRQGHNAAAAEIQDSIVRMLAADNPRFDIARFNLACEPTKGNTK